jgi:hypothetical protein
MCLTSCRVLFCPVVPQRAVASYVIRQIYARHTCHLLGAYKVGIGDVETANRHRKTTSRFRRLSMRQLAS